MDWGVFALKFGVSLLVTIFVYLLVPTIVVLSGKPRSVSSIKKIAIINSIICFLIFSVIQIDQGKSSASIGPLILWGNVGYWMMKSKCYPKTSGGVDQFSEINKAHQSTRIGYSPENEVSSYLYEPQHVSKKKIGLDYSEMTNATNVSTVPHNGAHVSTVINSNTKKSVALVIFMVLTVFSVALNVYLYINNTELSSGMNSLREENSALKKKIDELEYTSFEKWSNQKKIEEKLDFYDEFVVFVEDDGTRLYHQYDCHKFIGDYFWAFNVDAAIDEGFYACPLCCD